MAGCKCERFRYIRKTKFVGLLGSSLLNHFGGLVSSDRSDKAGSVSSGSASPTSKLSIVDVAVGSDSTSRELVVYGARLWELSEGRQSRDILVP